MNPRTMKRVTKSTPCPICGKSDWCLRAPDSSAAICARIKSSKPVGKREHAGWLHVLSAGSRFQWRIAPFVKDVTAGPTVNIDWPRLAATFTAKLTTARLSNLATALGLTVDSLARLNIGWSTWHRAYSFPMRTADGAIVGIRLRKPDGFKYCVKGSRSALFIPEGLIEAETLCIAEGPTDCAALLDMGLVAVGRPSCSGGVSQVLRLVRRLHCAGVMIVADGDQPGQAGANMLADELSSLMVELRIVTPPSDIKDAREWRQHGATASELLSAPAIRFPHPAIRRANRHAVQHRRRERA